MRRAIRRIPHFLPVVVLIAAAGFCACGGGGGLNPMISIRQPTTAPVHSQADNQVTLRGFVEDANYVNVTNTRTGTTVAAAIDCGTGDCLWTAELSGLAAGENVIVATADLDNTGQRIDTDTITIIVEPEVGPEVAPE